MNWLQIERILLKAWGCRSELLSSYIDVSRYERLNNLIPDEVITIEDVFSLDDIKGFYLEPYFTELEIIPFIGTLCDPVICIGYGEGNVGKIFYFDFDFGCIPFGDDDLDTFMMYLRSKDDFIK